MRKYTSLILLILILFIGNGYYFYFKFQQYNIKNKMEQDIKKGLYEHNLSLIIVSKKNKDEIHWIKTNKEFRYKSLMYDIVKIEIKNNKKYYYCINDIKEKELISNYTRHNRRRNSILLKLRKILNNKYFPENLSINQKTNKAYIYFSKYKENYSSIYIETLSPPPKV